MQKEIMQKGEMRVEVIVLGRRTLKQIAVWEYEIDSDSNSHIIEQHNGERFPCPEAAWKSLALAINQLGCKGSSDDAALDLPVDLFLLVRGSLVEHLSKNVYLENLVRAAHNHTWGGNIYIVWDQTPETMFDNLYNWSKVDIQEWFSNLIQSGVTDMLEISEEDKKTEKYNRLHNSARASEKRRNRLRKMVNDGNWDLSLHDDSLIGDFIQTLVGPERESTTRKNLAVLYETLPTRRTSFEQRLLKLYEQYEYRNLFLASIVQGDMSRTEMLWRLKSPGTKLFCFNGALEWAYSFVRLKQSSRQAGPQTSTTQIRDDFIWIVPSKSMLDRSEPSGEDLRLLVTSSFYVKPERDFDDPERRNTEEQYCIDAANEIGSVMRKLPFNIAVEVHHCIKCEWLPGILKDKSFTTWLHLSHGSLRGLKEDKTGAHASAVRWRDCFNVYKERLPLVIFSACKSTEVAKLFAESVASIAIGFENKVLTTATRKLSEEVIPAALRAGGRQTAILYAFGEAVALLSSTSYPGVKESDAKPKAFAANLEAS